MADPCLTFIHVAEHPVAKYTIGQLHTIIVSVPCNEPFAAVCVLGSHLKMNIC